MSSTWPTVALGTLLTDIQPGFASGRHNSDGEGIPHFRPMNVSTDGRIDRSVMKYVDPSVGRSDVRLRRGDILFNNTNSPELVGKTAIFEDEDSPAFSNHMTRLRVDETRLDARFAALRLHQAWREGWFAAHCKNHVSQASIGRDVLKTVEIELPPLDVQRNIASLGAVANDTRSSASTHLSAAQKAIERFRRAVLTAACSGRLTADWRGQHRLEKPEAPVGTVKRPRQLRSIEAYDLDDLPETWRWVQVHDLLPAGGIFDGPFGSNLKSSDYTDSGARVVRLENVGHLRFIGSKQSFVSEAKYKSLLKHAVYPGDIIFSSFVDEQIRVCVLPRDLGEKALAKADCFTLRPLEHVDPKYLAMQMASPRSYGLLVSDVHGATRPRVNTTQVRSLPVPLCTLEEQHEIIRRFDALMHLADGIQARIEAAGRKVEDSAQAFLAKAFRGELSASCVGQ